MKDGNLLFGYCIAACYDVLLLGIVKMLLLMYNIPNRVILPLNNMHDLQSLRLSLLNADEKMFLRYKEYLLTAASIEILITLLCLLFIVMFVYALG